jgi:hypothetical protein
MVAVATRVVSKVRRATIVAVPGASAATRPAPETAAMVGDSDAHTT